jgi:hypothetical protein
MHVGGDEPDTHCWSEENEKIDEIINEGGYQSQVILNMFNNKRKERLHSVNPNITSIYWYQNDKTKYAPEDILQYYGPERGIGASMNKNPENLFILSSMNYVSTSGYPDPFGSPDRWGN